MSFKTETPYAYAILDAREQRFEPLLTQLAGQTDIPDANLPRVRPLRRLDYSRIYEFLDILPRHFSCNLRTCRFKNEDHTMEQLDDHIKNHNFDVCYCSRW